MVIDLPCNRFVMNMQLRQCFARARAIQLNISQKKAKGVQKKLEFQNLASKKLNWQRCYTRIENAHKVLKKTLNFCYVYKSRKLSFLHPCWDIMKCLNASMSTTAVFELVQQFYHATETAEPMRSALVLISHMLSSSWLLNIERLVILKQQRKKTSITEEK